MKLPHYLVEEVRETGHNPAISAYLAERGLWQQRHHLKEVYYYVLDEKHNKKEFFAAGSQNDLGGWEVRNRYFKGCLGKKALTTIPGNADKLCLFEGFLDYLSWKSDSPNDSATVIVLNSLALLTLVLKRISGYQIIEVFFDHDAAGRLATTDLMKAVPAAKDMSDIYQGFKDYNDQLMTAFTNRTHTFK